MGRASTLLSIRSVREALAVHHTRGAGGPVTPVWNVDGRVDLDEVVAALRDAILPYRAVAWGWDDVLGCYYIKYVDRPVDAIVLVPR